MTEQSKQTQVQQHYKDVLKLHEEGIDLTPEELAQATGGTADDLKGIHTVQPSEELKALQRDQTSRHLRMAGMSDHPDGDDRPIGFALLADDLKRLRKKLFNR